MLSKFSTKDKFYIFLSTIFIISLVVGNLIFKKFVDIKLPFINHTFQISVGLCFFPLTFVVADAISEIYGREKANFVVLMGLVAGLFVMGVISLAIYLPATSWSDVSSEEFKLVFGTYDIMFLVSILASFVSQLLDVSLFLWIRSITHTKYLWLRNNVSTIISQFLDTFIVIVALHSFEVFPIDDFWRIFSNSFYFKVIFALLTTPIVYALVYVAKKLK